MLSHVNFGCVILCLCWLLSLRGVPGADANGPLIITRDISLEKGAALDRPIVIRASHVTIDGGGATLRGPGKAGDPKSFGGTGIAAEGCSGVTIRNIKVTGFQCGLKASDGEGWLIADCDFSGNFHDPEFGWGDLSSSTWRSRLAATPTCRSA